MNLLISNANNQPIYEQIYTQIRGNILSGTLREGDALPSIRSLAKDLRISVITTKRAYDELEKDGLIHTVAGKGCYVARRNMELVREDVLRQMEEQVRRLLALGAELQLSDKEIMDLLTEMIKEEKAE